MQSPEASEQAVAPDVVLIMSRSSCEMRCDFAYFSSFATLSMPCAQAVLNVLTRYDADLANEGP